MKLKEDRTMVGSRLYWPETELFWTFYAISNIAQISAHPLSEKSYDSIKHPSTGIYYNFNGT